MAVTPRIVLRIPNVLPLDTLARTGILVNGKLNRFAPIEALFVPTVLYTSPLPICFEVPPPVAAATLPSEARSTPEALPTPELQDTAAETTAGLPTPAERFADADDVADSHASEATDEDPSNPPDQVNADAVDSNAPEETDEDPSNHPDQVKEDIPIAPRPPRRSSILGAGRPGYGERATCSNITWRNSWTAWPTARPYPWVLSEPSPRLATSIP